MSSDDPRAAVDHPWDDDDRHAPERGWSYPLGRDAVERALHRAGARLDELAMVPQLTQDEGPGVDVLAALHHGDAWAGCSTAKTATPSPMSAMWCYAVPAEVKPLISSALRATWLPLACAWAASAASRGNAWSASRHEWRLRYLDGGVHVSET